MSRSKKLTQATTRHHNSIAEKKRKWIKLAIQLNGYSYDTAGRLVQQSMPNGDTVTYQLDQNGNRTRLIWPDGYYAAYVYDQLNRLTTISLNGSTSASVSFEYDELSRRTQMSYDNGCVTNYAYALNDDLSSLQHLFVGSAVTFSYLYNNVHQIVGLSADDSTYLWEPASSSTVTYATANDLNQYPSVGGTDYSYNGNGCLTAGLLCSANFDDLNRLTQANNGSNINNYLIDPLNRQAQKQTNDFTPTVNTITVESEPVALAIAPDGTKAYVCNQGSGSVSVINVATNTVSATVTVGSEPSCLEITPDGTKVYVLNTADGTASVISTSSDSVLATVTVGSSPSALAITPDGSNVYITNGTSNNVSVISTASDTVSATVIVGNNPSWVAITPDGTQAFVANKTDGTVSVIATSSNTVSATVTVGSLPVSIAITPDGTQAYVANSGAASVSVINTSSHAVSATVPVDSEPCALAVMPNGNRIFVVNLADGTVSVINTSTNTVIATISVGSAPSSIAVSPDGAQVYVANSGLASVSAINTCSNTVYATIDVADSPLAIAIAPSNGQEALVCNALELSRRLVSSRLPIIYMMDSNLSQPMTAVARY